ncbi:MAG TPA: acyl-CoA dehydrogenase family protein [Vicinamibacterales bacterium]|nr:acyl-CoA dehydrogenase family protein [Vicinamibacterales bacterium]
MSLLPASVRALQETAARIAREVLAGEAPSVDAEARWPERSLAAVAEAGLLGLHVPRRLGGLDEGMLALVVVAEELARECPSSALCYGMHCVATAVLAAKATPHHEESYLRPIAEGKHFTSLALSEAGTGVHFYWPQTRLERDGDTYIVTGTKQFVTSGGFAQSYVVTTASSRPGTGEAGEFSALVIDNGTPGVRWSGDWRGFGMRGNASKALELAGARVPRAQLLGKEGDEVWYVFEVIAPYFLMAMSGVYLGIAAAALDVVITDLQERVHAHTGATLSAEPVVQHRIADLWIRVQQARELVRAAARSADLGDPAALPALLASKAAASTAAVDVVNEAMTLGGGRAYRDNGRLSQMLRDARAGHVMAPTTDILKVWLGRSLLGEPLL